MAQAHATPSIKLVFVPQNTRNAINSTERISKLFQDFVMSGQVHVLGSPKYNLDRIHTHTDPNMNVYWNGILQSSRKIEEQTDSNGRCREKLYWSMFYREALDWLEEWEWAKMDDWVGKTRNYIVALATNENLIIINLASPIWLRSIRNPSYRHFMWQTARSKCFLFVRKIR